MAATPVLLPPATDDDLDTLIASIDAPAVALDPFGQPWICIIWPKAC